MANQILVPSLGESVTEATVSKWLKQVGEKVDSDEPLVELETDKVNIEVPSPLSGTLSSIKVKEGDTVEVGALLGLVNEKKSDSVKIAKTESQDKDQQSYTPPKIAKKNVVKETIKKSKKISPKKQETLTLVDESGNGALILDKLVDEDLSEAKEEKYIPPKTRQHLSPSVRKIVEEKNIDISSIKGTGKAGRISKGDLIKLMGNMPQPSKRKITHGPEERVKMTRLRLTIAKRLKEAQDSAAMLTTFNEVDMQNIIQMRKDYKEDFQKYKFPEKNEKIVPIYLLFKKYPNKDTLMLAFQFKYLDFKEDNIKIPKLDTVNLARTIEKRKTIYDFNLEEYYGFFYLD